MNDFSIKQAVEELIPFNQFMGIICEKAESGFARLRLPYRPEFIGNPRKQALHGGVLSMFVDTCAGTAVWSSCKTTDNIATIDMRVDYLRPVPPEDIIAEADVRLCGNRVANAHVVVFAASKPEKILAEGRCVYNIQRIRKKSD